MQIPQPGDVFEQKYKLLDVLGQGGFAVVFRARQIDVGRDVAIKVLLPRDGGYAGGLAGRFMREAKLVGQLRDPHTITMYDFGRSESGLLYMVTEFVEGIPLDRLVRGGPVSSRDAVRIVRQVTESLREAHQLGILHRDIKPANIMVFEYMGDPYCAKLLDFGIAKAAAGRGVELTAEGAIVGTPRYMSPEQLAAEELGPPTDFYSLGLVLYELLFGERAVSAETTRDVMRVHLDDTPHAIRAGASPAVAELLSRMLAKQASERFQNADSLLSAIAALPEDQLSSELSATKLLRGTSALGLAPTMTDATLPAQNADDGPRSMPSTIEEGGARSVAAGDSKAASSRFATGAVAALATIGLITVGALTWSMQNGSNPPPDVGDADLGPAIAPSDVGATTADTSAVAAPIPSGCGRERPAGWTRSVVDQTGEPYQMFVPSSYDKDTPARTILWFHPQQLNALSSAARLGIEQIAEELGALIVAPESRLVDPWVLGIAAESTRAQRTLRQAQGDYCVKSDGVFAVGFALGSRMARRVTCDVPELFRGVALIGHAPYRADGECFPEPSLATFHLGMDRDPNAPRTGGSTCGTPEALSLESYLESLRESKQCSDEELYFADDEGSCSSYACDRLHIECVVKSDVHHWPGSDFAIGCPGQERSALETTGFPATDLIGRFIDESTP